MSDNNFKLYGYCSILVSILFFVSLLINNLVYIDTIEQLGTIEYLTQYNSNSVLFLIYGLVGFIGCIVTFPATYGIYKFFKKNKDDKQLLIPLIGMFVGLFFLMAAYTVPILVALYFAPQVVSGNTDIIPTLLLILATMDISFFIGSILTFTVSIGVFSFYNLKNPSFPKTSSYLGMICGIFAIAWVNVFLTGPIAMILLYFTLINFITFLIWMILMGTTLKKA
ncbi:hypothetical protein LCGC14_0586830 [marine sediment metagenome]|uniref:DUF4386 domain-containing protein n=1 Tax=marine sediment metagenome TaxID=412755 RepID=A0A0F9RYJ7_9ZZZZ